MARTVSDFKTCKKCGKTDRFAWATVNGSWKLAMAQVDDAGKVVREKGSPVPVSPVVLHVCDGERAEEVEAKETKVETKAEVKNPPAPVGDLGVLLASLIGPHLAAKVDEMHVQRMIDEAIEAVAFERPKEYKLESISVTIEGGDHKSTGDLTVLALLAPSTKLWPYLYGPPGTGKSYGAVKLAQALGLEFAILPLGPATMPSSIFGFVRPDGVTVRTLFRERWEKGGVIILDELDQCAPELLTLLNGALANDLATFPDAVVPRHEKCYIVATGNTTLRGGTKGHESRRKVDIASQDRFAYLHWGRDESNEKARIKPLLNGHTDSFCAWIAKVRDHIDAHRPEILVSQRGAVGLAMAIATAKDSFSSVEVILNATIFRGIDSGVKDAILRDCPLPSFLRS